MFSPNLRSDLNIPGIFCIVLVRVSPAVKRYCDHGKSYKVRHLFGVAYSMRDLVHFLHGGTWQHKGQLGDGKGAESPTILLCRQQKESVSTL